MVARVGVVQAAVALVALALVALVTSLTVTTVLNRKTDEALEQVSKRVASVLQETQAQQRDTGWAQQEIQELKPVGMRVEVRDQGGRLWVSAGEAISLEGSAQGAEATYRPDSSSAFTISGSMSKIRIWTSLSIGTCEYPALSTRRMNSGVTPWMRISTSFCAGTRV